MAYWIWRMLHDVRVPPVESELHKGDIISPNHPYFPWLYDDYKSSRRPLMEPVLVRDGPTLAPGEPSARSVEGQHPRQDDDRAQWIAKILDPAIKPLFDPVDAFEPIAVRVPLTSEPEVSAAAVVEPSDRIAPHSPEVEVQPRLKRGRGRPRSRNDKAPAPDFTERLKDLSLPLAHRWKKKLKAEHVYGSGAWLKWHNSTSRSKFYRLLDEHGVKWEDFKFSLLSQISQ